eukprot:6199782-Pleurochrysis_carterae.AAC.1
MAAAMRKEHGYGHRHHHVQAHMPSTQLRCACARSLSRSASASSAPPPSTDAAPCATTPPRNGRAKTSEGASTVVPVKPKLVTVYSGRGEAC